MTKFIKVHSINIGRCEHILNSNMIRKIDEDLEGSSIYMGDYTIHCIETVQQIMQMIDSDLSNECMICGKYEDNHCDEFCTIVRHTIDDLKEYYKDSIPLDFIEGLAKSVNTYEAESSLNELIYMWKAEQEAKDEIHDEG